MSNSANWVAQKDCPYATGSVDVATGATPENNGDATFAQAFGAGPLDVYWSLQDSSVPVRNMAGIGSLSSGSLDVSTPSATFDGTTYDPAPSGVITLTSPVTVRCTVNASVFDSLGGTDLTNAVFPDSAHFASKIAADASVSFADGNKQEVNAAVNGMLTLSAPGVGSYILVILNSGSLTSITNTILWEGGTPPAWVGTSILALYYDGTSWYGSGMVGVA